MADLDSARVELVGCMEMEEGRGSRRGWREWMRKREEVGGRGRDGMQCGNEGRSRLDALSTVKTSYDTRGVEVKSAHLTRDRRCHKEEKENDCWRVPKNELCKTPSQSASCSPLLSPVTLFTLPQRTKSASLREDMKAVLQDSGEEERRSLSVGGEER